MKQLRKRWSCEGGYREVLVIGFPLFMSTGMVAIQYFVDRVFLARYSAEAIAASLPASLLNLTIISLFIGITQYVNTFTAQYYGARQLKQIGPALWQGIYISCIGGLLMLLLIPLAPMIFKIIGHSPVLQQLEVEYFKILCLGGMPAAAIAAFAGFYSGRSKPWPVMWCSMLMTAINLILDYIMIFGNWGCPEMGITGAGYATITAAFLTCIVYMIIAFSKENNRIYRTVSKRRPERDLMLRLFKFGFPCGMQFCLDLSGWTIFVLLVGRLGTVSLASTNIAFNINTLAFEPMLGIGMAVSVLVGQYLGQNKPEVAQKAVFSAFHMGFIYMLIIAASYVLVPDIYIMLYRSSENAACFTEIRDLTIVLLQFVALYSLFDAVAIIFVSTLIGAGDTRFVMFTNMFSSILILMLPTYFAIIVFGWGLKISWTFATSHLFLVAIVFYFRFRGGKWKRMRVIKQSDPA